MPVLLWHRHGLGRPEHHLIDGAAGGHHRVDALKGSDLHIEQVGAGFVDRLFERGGEFPRLVDGAAFKAVGGGELFGVGEGVELHGAEAVVVEERLPLADHAEMTVVHDDDLDRQAVAGDGGEVRDGHLEAAIAAEGENELIGAGHLRADGGRKPEAHGAEAAGVDPEAGFVEAAELGGPHLVLADVRGDDGVAAGEAVDFGHEVLGLDLGIAGGRVVGVLFFPCADLMPPGAAGGTARGIGLGGSFGEEFGELDEDAFDVADNGDFGSADLADFGRVDIDVDDLGVWGEGGEAAGDAVVETDAEGDEKVGTGQRHIGGVAAVHAGHGDEVGVIRGKGAETHEGSDDGSVGESNELAGLGGSVGGDDAAAGIAIPYYAILDADGNSVATYPGVTRDAGAYLAFLQKGATAKPAAAAAAAPAESAPSDLAALPVTTLDGAPVDTAALQGKVVVVDFWATYCVPCLKEIPTFNRLHEQYADRGVVVLGVSMDVDGGAPLVKSFLKKHPMKYRVVLGSEKTTDLFHVNRLPTTVVFDRRGKTLQRFEGYTPADALESVVKAAL